MNKWFLWQCKQCPSSMKINYIATEQDYNRFKDCHCGGELEYKADLPEDTSVSE
ncbi:MAG: hypothetical protein ACQEXQ_16145 [Bacillota bacterium]